MPKHPMRLPLLASAPALAALLLAGPAAADRAYYAWRTDEGAYAFTDDARAIPEAYRSQAQRRTLRSLQGYAHLTPSDARATAGYAKRLDARLEGLRERNRPAPAVAAPARRDAPPIALPAGGDGSPLIDVSALADGESDEPVIVETLSARPADGIVTHENTVVRQGDRTLAIVRSRPREWNLAEDIHIESDLE